PSWKEDRWLQAVAREMNVSETAFLGKKADCCDLRWSHCRTRTCWNYCQFSQTAWGGNAISWSSSLPPSVKKSALSARSCRKGRPKAHERGTCRPFPRLAQPAKMLTTSRYLSRFFAKLFAKMKTGKSLQEGVDTTPIKSRC